MHRLLRRSAVPSALFALVVARSVCALPLDRPADPVVLTGSAVPTLDGADPSDVVAFRWTTGWEPVPVQVDERALIDLNQPYGSYTCGANPLCFPLPASGAFALQYTDAATFTGADPDPTVDPDDEIVFMAKDTGGRPAVFVPPPGVAPGSGVEIRVSDPLDGGEGSVYLFRQLGGLDPAAGQSYVDYDFTLLSGPYTSTYQVNGGPNPEDSTVTSAHYTRHFADRWRDDGLAVLAGGATGVDLLDRHKSGILGGCARHDDTFDAGEGCFVVNKGGPVRAIRSYMGANSGPHTQRQHLFYERREDVRTVVRVHALPGASLGIFADYAPSAAGMVFRNDDNPGGVTIDGIADVVNAGSYTWETIDGAQGGLTILTDIETDLPGVGYTNYYVDDVSPAEVQCSGDASAYGSSGLQTTGVLSSTDVAAGGVSHLAFERIAYFEAPGEADGPGRRAALDNPLGVTVVDPSPPAPGDIPIVGLKLIVVDKIAAAGKAKAVFVAKDALVSKGAGTDPAQISSTLAVAYDGVGGSFLMPPGADWLVNSPSVAKYVHKTAPSGGAVKVSVVKPGSLVKVVAKSLGDSPLDVSAAPSGTVYVADTILNGSEEIRLCTQFLACVHKAIGSGSGYKLICKGDSLGDASCTAAGS